MPTVEELDIAYSDQISAGAAAGTASLNKLADAMTNAGTASDTVDTKITRNTKSATGYINSLDAVTKSANALNKAQNDLATMQDKLSAAVADGSANADAAGRALAAQQDKVTALTQRHADLAKATSTTAGATKDLAGAVDEASPKVAEHAGIIGSLAAAFGVSTYQIKDTEDELHKFVDQVVAGGSPLKALEFQLPTISQNLGGMGNVVKVVGGLLMGPAGLAVGALAVGAAFVAMGVSAETQQQQLATLSQNLRATRTDYDAVAVAATAAARQLATSTDISMPDARAATSTFAAVPTVDSTQLVALTKQAADLATVLGETVPQAAQAMAAAMTNPEKAAEDFAQKGLLGVREELAQQVKALQDSGNQAGAYALLMGQVTSATQGAARQGLTPYQQALDDLAHSFATPIDRAHQFNKSIGDDIVAAATTGIQALAGVGRAIDELRNNPLNGNDLSLPSQSVAGSSPSVSSAITSVGASLGANADVVSLAQRIAPIESSTGQFNKDGSVVTSSAGALGALQVEPMNANGNDLSTTVGNVTASEQLLMRLYTKYSGNQILVAMAYNWGEGNVDAYLARTIDSVPQSVQTYAQQVTGGQAYTSATTAAKQGTVDTALGTSDSTTAAQVQTEQRAIDQLSAAQTSLNDLHTAGSVSDADYADQTAKLTARLNEHQGALQGLRDPLQTVAHQQDLATQSAATYTAAQQAMVGVDQQVEEAAQRMGQAHATASQLADAEAAKQAQLTDEFNSQVAAIDEQTSAQNKMIAGYDGTTGSLTHYLDQEAAAKQVRSTSIDDTAEQARQTEILTNAMDGAATSSANLATAQGLLKKNQDLDTINEQIALLGTNSDDAARQMAALAEQQDLVRRYGSDAAAAASTQAQQEAALSDKVEVATLSYERQKQTLGDVTSGLSNMADTIGDDLTQAYVQGSGSAVTFTSALQGVETQVLSLIARLVLINPILNAIDGGTRSTISDVLGLLSGSSSSSVLSGASGAAGLLGGSSSSSLGLLSTGGSLLSSGSGGGLLSSLGLGGVGNSISSLLSTNLYGGTSAAGAIATSGDLNAAYTTTAGLGGTSLGSLLGGAGLGFGAGSLLNGLVGGNKTTGTLGSGVGAAAGAAIGSIIPGVGTLIGGLLGGAGGGLLGGLFGGHAKNPYTLDTVSTSGGQLSIGSSYNQAQTDSTTAQLASDIATLNATFKALGVTVSAGNGNAKGNLGIVGDGASNAQSSIASYLDAIRFQGGSASFGQATATGLSTADYASVSAFDTAITALKAMADTVDTLRVKVTSFNADAGTVTVGGAGSFSGYSAATSAALDHALDGTTSTTSDLSTQIATIVTFVESTMPSLLQETTAGSSSFEQSLQTLTATYTSAETEATSLGINTDGLAAKLKSLTADMYAAAQTTLDYQTAGYQARDDTATGNAEGAALINQNLSAQQEKTAFNTSWQDIYGTAYQAQVGYAAALATLDKTQSDERLAIETQYQQQLTALAQTAHSAAAAAVGSSYTSEAALVNDGTPSGQVASLQYQKAGALYTFDDQQQSTIDAFTKTFTDAYGSTITQTQGFAVALQQEETSLGLQRLAIAKQYDDQITAVTTSAMNAAAQSAGGVIDNLTSYVKGLATSSASPLSAADQYKAANDNFSTDLAAAKGGDYTALQALQGDSDTLLTQSQSYNGSGVAYANDYSRVLDALQSVAGMGSDAVTQSALNASLQTATQTLADKLDVLNASIAAVKLELSQSNLRKAA